MCISLTATANMTTCCLPYFHGFPQDRVAVWFPTMISEHHVSPTSAKSPIVLPPGQAFATAFCIPDDLGILEIRWAWAQDGNQNKNVELLLGCICVGGPHYHRCSHRNSPNTNTEWEIPSHWICCCNSASINHDSYLLGCSQKKHSPLPESICFLLRFSGHTCHNVFPHNLDKPVPITPCLFMDETQCMVHFVLNCSFIHATIFHQAYCLTSSNFSKVRPAAKNKQSISKMITLSKIQRNRCTVYATKDLQMCSHRRGHANSEWCEISRLPKAAKLHRERNKAFVMSTANFKTRKWLYQTKVNQFN